MGNGLVRLLYWVAAFVVVFWVHQARVFAPFGRAFLGAKEGLGAAARDMRVWAQAVLVSVVWVGVPELCWRLVEPALRQVRITPFWIDSPGVGGSAFWWFMGVGLAFGLLYRSPLAALITGGIAFVWQWAMLGGPVTELMKGWAFFDGYAGWLIVSVANGLVVGLADLIAGHAVSYMRRRPVQA